MRYFDIVSTYIFKPDSTFVQKIDYYGFKDDVPNEIIGQSETSGVFELRGDSVFINVRQRISWEKGFRPEPEMVFYNTNKGYGSRFAIVAGKLTL